MHRPWSSFSARIACLAAALALGGCGGGGGGSGGGSGGTQAASLSVTPKQLTVNASADTSSTPSGTLTIKVNNGSPDGTYVGANYSSNAIAGLTLSDSGTTGLLTVTFQDPSVIGPGTYKDTVQIAICTDSTCNTIQGSLITVPVTYVVTISATATFSAFPATVTLGKPATLRWQSQFAANCVASGDWSGSLPAAGFQTLVLGALGTTHYHLACSNSTSTDQKDATITVVAAPAVPAATAYRMNEAHDGVLTTSNGAQYPPQAAPTWSRDLGAPVSYPLIANGKVFVATANPDGSYGNQLYALDAGTGATVWGPIAISGTYFGSGLTYEDGKVFVLMFEGGVHAFDASNGAALWTTQLPGYWYEATPNAYGGIVFISGNAGMSAVDEASGTILWTSSGAGGTTDWASPSISSEGAYQQGGGCFASALDPGTGTTLWQTQSPCDSPWGFASVIRNGRFFGRVGTSLDLFAAATGVFSTQIGASLAPSVTDTTLFAMNAGILSSTRLADLVQTWTFTGDNGLVTAPVVVNNTVFVGSSSGKVYGVDATTGLQVWAGTSPVAIINDSETGGPMPPSGPAAGENLLIFIASNTLVAWQLQ